MQAKNGIFRLETEYYNFRGNKIVISISRRKQKREMLNSQSCDRESSTTHKQGSDLHAHFTFCAHPSILAYLEGKKKKKTSINKQVHAYTDARMYVIIVIGVVRGSQSLESRFLFNHRTKLAKSVQ